jgi:hypothetical protein
MMVYYKSGIRLTMLYYVMDAMVFKVIYMYISMYIEYMTINMYNTHISTCVKHVCVYVVTVDVRMCCD